jgi:hypothetical protein
MIEALIADLTSNQISLSEGLTKAKLIATKTNDIQFVQSLNKDILGYDNENTLDIPEYRKLQGSVYADVKKYPWSKFKRRDLPIEWLVETKNDGLSEETIYNQFILYIAYEPIREIEEKIKSSGDKIIILIDDLVLKYTGMADLDVDGNMTTDGIMEIHFYKEILIKKFQRILDFTKSRLLDKLVNIKEKDFPYLFEKNDMGKDKSNIAQHVNIYGNNNPVNLGAGHSVTQSNSSHFLNSEEYQKLRSLGVPDEKIDEVKDIYIHYGQERNNHTFSQKLLKWFGEVSSHVAAIGLGHNISAIYEHIQNWINDNCIPLTSYFCQAIEVTFKFSGGNHMVQISNQFIIGLKYLRLL